MRRKQIRSIFLSVHVVPAARNRGQKGKHVRRSKDIRTLQCDVLSLFIVLQDVIVYISNYLTIVTINGFMWPLSGLQQYQTPTVLLLLHSSSLSTQEFRSGIHKGLRLKQLCMGESCTWSTLYTELVLNISVIFLLREHLEMLLRAVKSITP